MTAKADLPTAFVATKVTPAWAVPTTPAVSAPRGRGNGQRNGVFRKHGPQFGM